MDLISITPKDSIIFQDNKVLVALAFEPITHGHAIVIWKNGNQDINQLQTEDYEYLMDVVGVIRETLKSFYNLEKVYLMYLDEINWVHWHLVPRYDEKGFNVLTHKPERIYDFQDVKELADIFKKLHQKMIIEN